jgi:hypothetical protein
MASIRQRLKGDRSERGAALLVGLLFMTVGSLLALSLASSAGNNLLNTSNFQSQRNIEYAADGALTGAVQASRYHFPPANPPQPCVPFAPTAPLANGLYVYVQCSGTPMFVTTDTTPGRQLFIFAPAGTAFVPQDNGMVVSGGCIQGTQTVTYVNATELQMSQPATCTATIPPQPGIPPTIVGGYQQRTVLFWACVSPNSLSSCSSTSTNLAATATVTYSDTDNNGNQAIGYNADVQSWVVKAANG